MQSELIEKVQDDIKKHGVDCSIYAIFGEPSESLPANWVREYIFMNPPQIEEINEEDIEDWVDSIEEEYQIRLENYEADLNILKGADYTETTLGSLYRELNN